MLLLLSRPALQRVHSFLLQEYTQHLGDGVVVLVVELTLPVGREKLVCLGCLVDLPLFNLHFLYSSSDLGSVRPVPEVPAVVNEQVGVTMRLHLRQVLEVVTLW